jgi:hypothetical protein
MHRLKSLFLLAFMTLMPYVATSQYMTLSENSTVSILTCGTGNEVYSLFGHTAIRIKDPQKNIDIVYNYGAFDFEAANFILRFTKGDLQYFVTASSFMDFIEEYHYEKRSVYEQVLDIPLAKRQLLFDRLNTVLFSNERFYTYKFIDRNCTNMAVDILNKTLGSKLVTKKINTEPTYREVLYPYFNGHFYEQLGTSIIFGTKVDRRATVLFLPIEFQQNLETSKYLGKPLVAKARIILADKSKESNGSWWNNIYTYLLLLVLVIVINRTPIALTYFTVVGLIGVFFSIAGWYSLHEELARNYNMLLFNPATLLLMYFYYTKKYKLSIGISLFCVLSVAIYLIVMIDKIHLLIVTPIVVTNLILFWRYASRSRARLRM